MLGAFFAMSLTCHYCSATVKFVQTEEVAMGTFDIETRESQETDKYNELCKLPPKHSMEEKEWLIHYVESQKSLYTAYKVLMIAYERDWESNYVTRLIDYFFSTGHGSYVAATYAIRLIAKYKIGYGQNLLVQLIQDANH